MRKLLLIPIFLVAAATAATAAPGATPAAASGKAAPAAAAPAPAATAQDRADEDCARARKQHRTCVLNMGGETVDGKGIGGDGTIVTGVQASKMPSLVHYRADFRAEIIKSAEDL